MRQSVKWVMTAAMVTTFASRLVHASEYWVGLRGVDRQQGGAQTSPWASLQFAADHVKAGDIVHVLDGDYVGFDLRTAGNEASPIHFVAEGKNVKITRRNHRTPDGINLEGAGYVILEGFRVEKMPRAGIRAVLSPHVTIGRACADRNGSWGIFTAFCDDLSLIENLVSKSVKEHGIYVSNSGDRPIIRGNVAWDNRGCGIHMNGDLGSGGDGIISGALVENNIIFGNGRGGGSGINADGVQDSRFQNNLLYGNHANGISLFRICGADGSTGNLVVNNTIMMPSDARWAVNIQSASTSNKVFNNILLHASPLRGSINISRDSMPGFQSDHNLVVDRFLVQEDSSTIDLARWQSLASQDLHSRVSQPVDLFVDEASRNYHLRGRSPAIDAADPALAPRLDIEGKARQRLSEEKSSQFCPDIGAYEYVGRG
ncbi:MAG: right-handed parallel beta-helix repeat-containing protein [Isosphaeraceae bacterium]